jgi:hypothetical protein
MRFSTWSKLLSHYSLNAHLPKWLTKQSIYTNGSTAVWFQRLKLDLYQHLQALTTSYTQLALQQQQQQCHIKVDQKTDSTPTRVHAAVVTKSRPFAKYLATAQQKQLDAITALLQCFSCCCETLIGVHTVSIQSGMNIVTCEFQGLDVFELLQK